MKRLGHKSGFCGLCSKEFLGVVGEGFSWLDFGDE